MTKQGILLLILLSTIAVLNNRCSNRLSRTVTTTKPRPSNSKEAVKIKEIDRKRVDAIPNTVETKGADNKFAQVASYTETFLGSKYKYGGTSRSGFDCSGLVFTVMGKFDVKMYRTSADQAKQGKKISQRDVQVGDLVFFSRTPNGRIFHVGIVTEVNKNAIFVVHSTSSKGVIKDNILHNSYWKPKISSFRRVL